MTPKIKATSSKSYFRWPWSKKGKAGDQSVAQQPELEDQAPTQRVDPEESNSGRIPSLPRGPVQAKSPIVVSSSALTALSSGERRLEDPASTRSEAEAALSTSGLKTTQAETPSSLFSYASNFVVNGGINVYQPHEFKSNDPGEL